MLRALLVTGDFPPQIGGVATYYHELCRNFPTGVIRVLTTPQAAAESFDRGQAYPILRRPLLSQRSWIWPRWLPAISWLRRALTEGPADVLFVGEILPYGTIAWILHRQRGLPYVVFAHGMDVGMPHGRRRWLCRMILRDAERVLANSYATHDLLLNLGVPPAKITVLTPGVAPPTRVAGHTLQTLRERYRLDGHNILLSVGRLVRRKGHRLILEALPRLLGATPNLRYVVVGDGPYRSPLARLAGRLHVIPHVHFTGQVTAVERSAWYELCDIFVLTPEAPLRGDIEGFGLVYLEANSYAKPVVGTRVGGVGEAIVPGQTGLLVAPGDSRALAAAMGQLLLHPAYAHRLGLQGQDRVLREFRWQDRADFLLKLLLVPWRPLT